MKAKRRFFLFSPASSYPQPFACLIDDRARTVHVWSNTLDQPDPSDRPPTYLRGWNHVEVGPDGSLYVLVPLQSLLKLNADSEVIWRAQVSAHHDLHVAASGTVHVLTERPRVVDCQNKQYVILDNLVTIINSQGETYSEHSIYDVLIRDPILAMTVRQEITRRHDDPHAGLRSAAGSEIHDHVSRDETDEPHEYGHRSGSLREVLRTLRDLPGCPSDVMHANTIEVLVDHPAGLWRAGDVLLSLRNLNLILIIRLESGSVVWSWGPGVLSGQHQPSMLPSGNILVFDNGATAGRSRVLELDPITTAQVWEYVADPPESLFSSVAGGCELLDNGNVLISDAATGRAIEVTREGVVAWGVQIEKSKSCARPSRASIYRMSAVHEEAVMAGALGATQFADRRIAEHQRISCHLI